MYLKVLHNFVLLQGGPELGPPFNPSALNLTARFRRAAQKKSFFMIFTYIFDINVNIKIKCFSQSYEILLNVYLMFFYYEMLLGNIYKEYEHQPYIYE